jgi:ribokinase
VDGQGQNSIIIFGGANRTIGEEDVARAVSSFRAGDYAVLQNEINMVGEIMKRAKSQGMRVVLNPSPMDCGAISLPYELCDILVLNEIEAVGLLAARLGGAWGAAGSPAPHGSPDTQSALAALAALFPKATVALTRGSAGAMLASPAGTLTQSAYETTVVDTTAAGDTFTGYLVASIASGAEQGVALRRACAAAAISVSRAGAEPSIPWATDVDIFLQARGDEPN